VQWAVGYSLVLIGILVFSFEYGRRFLGVSLRDDLRKNTDELIYAASAAVAAKESVTAMSPAGD
jgi:hypothetical protein